MRECLWVKRGNSLVPSDVVTADLLARTENGAVVRTSPPRSPRNPDHHRFMMAILSKVVENTDDYADIDDLMFELKLRCKMGRWVKYNKRGDVAFVPKSISFAAMSQQQFRAVADRWLYVIKTEIMPGVDPEALVREAREAS
jgi:hypothetical protein